MAKKVKLYVGSSAVCNQSKKPTRHSRFPMFKFHAGIPMERVHINFIGPMPKITKGNQHILMMVDQFTKWIECVPLPSQTPEVTAHAAICDFLCV